MQPTKNYSKSKGLLTVDVKVGVGWILYQLCMIENGYCIQLTDLVFLDFYLFFSLAIAIYQSVEISLSLFLCALTEGLFLLCAYMTITHFFFKFGKIQFMIVANIKQSVSVNFI